MVKNAFGQARDLVEEHTHGNVANSAAVAIPQVPFSDPWRFQRCRERQLDSSPLVQGFRTEQTTCNHCAYCSAQLASASPPAAYADQNRFKLEIETVR
jgi:hypothetical protein